MAREEVFGLFLSGALLTIVVTLGFIPLIKSNNELADAVRTVHQDKNTEARIGSDISEHGNYDNMMNKYEVILCTQVQDSFMPDPKSLAIGDYVIGIQATHEVALQSYGVAATHALSSMSASDTDRFRVKYDNKFKQKKEYKVRDDGQVDLLESPLRPQEVDVDKTVETFKIEKVE